METNPPQGNPNVDSADVPPANESDREPVVDASAAVDEIAVVETEATDDAEELPEADGDTPPFLEFLDDWEKEQQPDK
jgi:hypothetical protein